MNHKPLLLDGPQLRDLTASQADDATWLISPAASNGGSGAIFTIPATPAADWRFVSFDILLSGNVFVTFILRVVAGEHTTSFNFSSLCECQTRITFPLPQDLDFSAGGRVEIAILRKTDQEARFRLWPVALSVPDPGALREPLLPRGPIIDAMGQSTIHDWPNRTASVAEMVERLQGDAAALNERQPLPGRSRWGGWAQKNVGATGFFRTHHDGARWWLVDPDGCLFWSSGLDCVHTSIDHESVVATRQQDLASAHAELPRPLGAFGRSHRVNVWHAGAYREYNYLEGNFIRAFGAERWYEKWAELAHADLRHLGFNTAGDWSDEHAASRLGTPYARALELWFHFPNTPLIYADFPDVFHPNFAADADRFAAAALGETLDDPAMLGYFLHNEPGWHSPDGGPTVAILQTDAQNTHSRAELVAFLRARHDSDAALTAAWRQEATFAELANGAWTRPFTTEAMYDLEAFSTILLEHLIRTISEACRRFDPNHLNLGVRWWSFPPMWALRAMGSVDVISYNYYQKRVAMVGYMREKDEGVEEVAAALNRPFMIGEWHWGALDAGLSSAGLCRVADQEARGVAFRTYTETAAALSWCVGAHWFNYYDRTALSSTWSSENYNIGFFDITHRAHEPICKAARLTHERLYEVAAGLEAPYDVEVEELFPSR